MRAVDGREAASGRGEGVEGREPCPAPLSWPEVLAEYRNQSHCWELERRGYTLRGRTWGEGPPLYFLNGLGGTHELFALLVWLLREDFRCVLYDDPRMAASPLGEDRTGVAGSEQSDGPAIEETGPSQSLRPGHRSQGLRAGQPPESAAELAADLCAVADRHGDQRFSVYSASFGCVTALAALLNQPQRIERAVVQTGFAYRKLSWCERRLIAMCRRLPGRLGSVPFQRHIQQQNHLPWFPPVDPTRWRFFLENTESAPIAGLAERAAVLKEFDLRRRLPEIRQPVLLVGSEGEGRIATGCREELAAGLPNARVEWLHSCGQLPYLTHPHRLAKVIKAFLNNELEKPEE